MATFEEEQAAIARRQQIAQQLMAQGAEPMETNQVAGGYVVPVSGLGALGKIAQQLSGAYIAKQADKRGVELQNQRLEELGGIDFNAPDASSKLLKMGMVAEALKLRHSAGENGGFQLGYDSQGNPFRFNKNSGAIGATPSEDGGKYTGGSALYNPEAIAAREQAKQGQKGVKVTDEQGREYYAPQAATNPQFKDYTQPTTVDISPDASPEDRVMLEAIARQTGGNINAPVKSQSPAEAAAAKVTAELPYKTEEVRQKALVEQDMKLNDPERIKGKQAVNELLDRLDNYYTELDNSGGIVNPDKGAARNIIAGLSSTGFGQFIGNKVGTKDQSARNNILAARSTLVPTIMKASGMTGSQLNSEAELQQFLKSMTDPDSDIKTQKEQIQTLRKMYGMQDDKIVPAGSHKANDIKPVTVLRFDKNGELIQ